MLDRANPLGLRAMTRLRLVLVSALLAGSLAACAGAASPDAAGSAPQVEANRVLLASELTTGGLTPPTSRLAASDGPAAAALPGLDGRWVYTEFPESSCRDGTPAGVVTNLRRGSNKLMVFLEQGGACFNADSCSGNPATALIDLIALGWVLGADGVFDRTHPDNPTRDWNIVYIPYCTGDLHLGSRRDSDVPGVGPQQFVGYQNMAQFLPRIAATFPDATDVLLTGTSAGGFGSLAHLAQVQAAFPAVKVKMVDDSGPPLGTALFPTCMQRMMRELWGIDATTLADCGSACPKPDDFFRDYGLHVLKRFADRPLGLVISSEDSHLRAFGDAGANDCTGAIDLEQPQTPGSVLVADLLGLREQTRELSHFSTFFPPSDQHTWIASPGFYTVTAGGVSLVDWFTSLLEGEVPAHSGP